MVRWRCRSCRFIYDEKMGIPYRGVKPGTKFKDLPVDWKCPVCGASKEFFEEVGGV
jgi:rubredoxin